MDTPTLQHLTDGPTEIPAWKSCDGCRHFKSRRDLSGGTCKSPQLDIGIYQPMIFRDRDGRVVTPSWCPVLLREAL